MAVKIQDSPTAIDPLPTRQVQVPKAKVSRASWLEAIADLDHGLFSKNANLLSAFE